MTAALFKRKPRMKRLQAAMLSAVKAAGGSAWYVPDDFLVLGPNIFENGDFSQGSAGWNPVAATFSVANGEATVTATSTASPQIYKSFPAVPGRSYLLSFEAKNISATDVRLYAGGILATSSSATWTPMRGVINAGSASPNLICLLSASAAGQQGAFRNVEVREIQSTKDWQDSAGTLPSYLGGTVGLMYDMAGAVGPDLIQTADTSSDWQAQGTTPPTAVNGSDIFLGKPCRSVTFPTIASGGYTVCRAVDVGNSFNITANQLYYTEFEYALSRDLTTGESVVIALTGVAGIYTKVISAGAAGNVWSKGAGGQIAATTGVDSLRPYATTLDAPLTVYIRRVSCKAVSGNTVVQSTAANRPTLTRIPRKLGAEKALAANYGVAGGGYDNTITGVTASGFTAVAGTTVSRVALNFPTEIGKTYNITARLATPPASGSVQMYSRDQYNGGGATITTTGAMTSGAIYNLQFTATSTSSSALWVSSANAQGFVVDSVSVKEVFEFSYALTFDGSNDSLAAPASVIGSNLSQPYTMIAWGRVGAIGTNRYFQGDSARGIGVSTSGKAMIVNTNIGALAGATQLAQGQLVIIEGIWDGATSKVYLNGVLDASGAHAASTGAPGGHSIGQLGLGSNYYNAEIGGSVVCPGVMTDAQRAAVRKFAAAQMGMSL